MKLEKPIDVPIEHFKKHLIKEENERILFSGRFGIGKTWFLNEFFNKNKDSYIKIHLYPVNYSVAANKDVFELIKVDILFEILKLNIIDFESFEFSKSLLIQQFMINKAEKLFPFLLEKSQDIGESILDFQDFEDCGNIKTVHSLVKLLSKLSSASSLSEYKKKVEENQKLKDIRDFFKSKTEEIGNIYEYNLITELLIELIEQIRGKGEKIVLVIDDLDRIDPEHVFRILNVFSAHFDIEGSGNKFGFDKVIFVCDIKNLKSTFQHRYGIETDFEGYINKFFSSEVYKYDNSKNINKIVHLILEKYYYIVPERSAMYHILYGILQHIVINGKISLRNLLQDKSESSLNYNLTSSVIGKFTFSKRNFFILEPIQILSAVLGGIENLINYLEESKHQGNNPFASSRKSSLKHIIPLLDMDNTIAHFNQSKERNISYSLISNTYKINYNLCGDNDEPISAENIECISQDRFKEEVNTINVMPFYIDACKTIKKMGFII